MPSTLIAKKIAVTPKPTESLTKEKKSSWQDFFDKKKKESIEESEKSQHFPKAEVKKNHQKKRTSAKRVNKKSTQKENISQSFGQVFRLKM